MLENRQPTFRVLGSLEIWQGEKRIRLGGPRQERALGLMLLDANRQVPLHRLVRTVWDEDPPATAAHQIRKIIGDLRQRIPGGSSVIRTEGTGYLLLVDDERLDLELFAARLARAREATRLGLPANTVTELQSALELWRGPVLGGRGGPVIDSVASALEERRLAAHEELIELQIANGQAGEVIADLRTLIADHPLRENLRAQLMLALYHCGRQAEALEEYDAARRLLANELGIDPGPELSRRYEGILRNSPDLAPPEHHTTPTTPAASWVPVASNVCTLPYDLPDFTGRHSEFRTLLDIGTAVNQALGLVTIDGMGGSGKTALAVHAAHHLTSRFPDAQLYIDLHGFSPGQQPLEPSVALDLLMRMLEVPGGLIPEDTTGRISLWRTVTANRRMLLLLDNASDASQVRPLLPVSASAMILVTSRVRMADLDGAVAVSTGRMSSADSRELLSRAFGAERIDAEQEAIIDLIELCGHLPLALRIAASRLRTRTQWSVRDLTARLSAEEGMLRELESGNRSVSATIALSYHALPESHRRLLRRLGAHPGTAFDISSVAALADMSVTAAERILDGLLDAHLLEQQAPDRYSFHDLVRSFVHSLVSAENFEAEQHDAWQRLFEDYLVTSRVAADILLPGRRDIPLGLDKVQDVRPILRDGTDALRWFDVERPNLISAVHRAIGQSTDRQAALLARDLGNYLQQRGFLRDLLEIQEAAVIAARRVDDHVLERSALIALAAPLWHAGRPKEAMNLLEQALESALQVQDQQDEAVILSRIGTQHSMLGDYAEALRKKERALRLQRELDSKRGKAWTLIGISSDQLHLGRYDQALATARRAFDYHRELGDSDGEIMALVNAANAANGKRDHEAALSYLRKAHSVADQVASSDGLALVRIRMCDTYVRQGAYQMALNSSSEALDAARSVQRPSLVAIAENVMGLARLQVGEPDAALELYRNALEVALESDNRYEAARAQAGTGDAMHALGREAEALAHWEMALRHFTDMGVPEAAEVAAKLACAQAGSADEEMRA